MKAPQFYIVTVAAALCLILSILLVAINQSNQDLIAQIETQTGELNQANTVRQALTNLVKDVHVASSGNEKLQALLKKHGVSIRE